MPPLDRIPSRDDPQRVPRPVPGEPGLFTVDGTWGTITPIALPGGVETVGELEVIAQIEAGRPLVDTRKANYVAQGTIPGAVHIDHDEIAARIGELDRDTKTVLFCNGPQCAATPDAIAKLVAAGFPAAQLRFYRGGIHDWVTLGLPLEMRGD